MRFWKQLFFFFCFVQSTWNHSKWDSLYAQEPASTANAQVPTVTTSDTDPILPDEWLGSWQGMVTFESAERPSYSLQINLTIAASDKPDRLLWTIILDHPLGKTTQEYELVKEGDHPALFSRVDKDGGKIPAIMVEQAILSQYSNDRQTILSKYELTDSDPSEMIFETVEALNIKVPAGGNEGVPEVTSFYPSTRQIGKLKRIANPNESSNDPLKSFTNWKKLDTVPHDDKQDDIYFVDDRVGWYANGAGKIYKTTDGGDTWKLQRDTPGTFFRCLSFIDQQHGFAGNVGLDRFDNVTDSNPLYETKDGGETWNAVTTIEGKPVEGLCALQVLRYEANNEKVSEKQIRLIGVGRVAGPAALIVSDDLGATWQQIDISAHAAMAFDVHFLDRNVGFIAAATDPDLSKCHAAVLRTEDGGVTWQKVYESPRPHEWTWKMSFPSRNTGYVTIQSLDRDKSASARYVAKTQDGGKTWSEIPLVNNFKVRQFGIAFLDDQTGWVGATPHGFFTNNGGKTWRRAKIGDAVNRIRLLSTPSKTVGFAIGTEVHRFEMEKVEK